MFSSRYFLTYGTISFAETVTVWLLWLIHRSSLPGVVPLNYLAPWGEAQLIPSNQLWILPAGMTLGFIISTLFAGLVWKNQKLFSQILLSNVTLINSLGLLGMLKLIFAVT